MVKNSWPLKLSIYKTAILMMSLKKTCQRIFAVSLMEQYAKMICRETYLGQALVFQRI